MLSPSSSPSGRSEDVRPTGVQVACRTGPSATGHARREGQETPKDAAGGHAPSAGRLRTQRLEPDRGWHDGGAGAGTPPRVGRGAAHGLSAGTAGGAWQRSPPHEEIPYLQIRRIAEETPCFNEEDRSTHCLLRIKYL
eukprot:scaffold3307_cov39-Phaeocystis_antarctica.AAC.3